MCIDPYSLCVFLNYSTRIILKFNNYGDYIKYYFIYYTI